MDNFKNGIASFGIPVLAVPDVSRTGDVYWVDYNGTNSSDNTSSGSYEIPFKTLDYAVGRCTANNGDIINIKEGHTETITASTLCAIDVAGLTVVGMGSGADRPTFTVSTDATATITISGTSTKLKNILVIGALDGLNTAVTVSGNDCDLDFEYRDTSSTVEADIVVAASGDRLKLNLRVIGFAGDQMDQAVTLSGVDNARINIDFFGKVGTAVVDMLTACTDIEVRGTMYVSGTTDGSKNVVDTAGTSTWYMDVVDAAAGARYTGGSASTVASDDVSILASTLGTVATAAATGAVTATDNAMGYIKQLVTELQVVDAYFDVPTADATTDTTMRDVVGKKNDAAVNAVATTKSVMAYAKGIVNEITVPTADVADNGFINDVIGNKTDAAVGAVTTTKSLMGYLKGVLNAVTAGTLSIQERVAVSATAVMVNGDTIFTVAGGPIEIVGLWSECVTANDGTASTLQYSVTHATLGDVTISGASGSLASVAAGSHVTLQSTALNTAALLSTEGATIHATGPSRILMQPGAIKVVIGTGSTTGTWKHYLRYKPMAVGVTVA